MPSNYSASNTKCFLEIEVSGKRLGRLIFKLYTDLCPKTCENFRCLCTGEKGYSRTVDKALHYKNSPFHRVVKGFMIQGGDFTRGDGKGGESIYGGQFEDEDLSLKHDKPYLLSMANRGKDTNKSQFFITTAPASHLDGVHVVFGELISGFELVRDIEEQPVDSKSRPINKIMIADCGEVKQETSISVRGDERIKRSRSKERMLPKKYSSRRASVSPSSSDHSSKSLSRSSSSSSSSSASSSTSSSGSETSSGSSSSSISDESSDADSSSSSSSSDRSRSVNSSSSSSSSYSSGDSRRAARKKRKKEVSSKRQEKERPDKVKVEGDDGDDDDIIVEVPDTKKEDEREYPCSVKLDEIPQVPMNKFLFRPIPRDTNKEAGDELEDDDKPIEVDRDLSRYQDKDSEDEDQDGTSSNGNNQNSGKLSSAVNTVDKPTRVSRSGRIMKGRGSFKFRTPSPVSRRPHYHYHERRRRSRSPTSYRQHHGDHRRDHHHRSSYQSGYDRC